MLLTALIFAPLVFALSLVFVPSERAMKPLTLVMTSLIFLLSLAILAGFDSATPGLQMVQQVSWVPKWGISYFVGIDGISLWLVILTALLTPLSLLGGWTSIDKNVKGFCISLLALETTMFGTFLAMDAILFYTFFEFSLIPMYFMIGIWGGSRRLYATVKFFIFTMTGSLFMLLGIIAMMFMTATLNPEGQMSASFLDFYKINIPFVAGDFLNTQTVLFFAFAFAFAIKCPVFPLHTWLPDAHVEAPTPGSVILAGVLLKMGTYGLLRLVIPVFPEAAEHYAWIFFFIGSVGIIYGALVAMVQPDIKKLVAYSSVSHMGYIILGLFAMNAHGLTGGLYQMLNHGVSTGALFLLVGMIYERTHTREIKNYGGLASAAPIFTILFLIVTLSSIAVPMTNGFIGEFLILMGTYQASPITALFAVTGVVLGAAYMLWMVKKVFYGEEAGTVLEHKEGLDLNTREILTLSPLIVLIFVMGLFPNIFLDKTKASIDSIIENRYKYELTVDGHQAPSVKAPVAAAVEAEGN